MRRDPPVETPNAPQKNCRIKEKGANSPQGIPRNKTAWWLVRLDTMTSHLLPMSKKEQQARQIAQAAEKEAYRRAKDLHRSEDSATRIACVAYERTYHREMNRTTSTTSV